MLCHEQMAAFMFAVTGNFPLAELYHPLHHLMGAGHLALAATFWAVGVRMLAGLQKICYTVSHSRLKVQRLLMCLHATLCATFIMAWWLASHVHGSIDECISRG